MRTKNYEPAPEYKGDYSVKGWGKGIAFRVIGWETEPDEDTEWTGYEQKTGWLLVCMIGDDRYHRVDPEDITSIPRSSYCGECGQIGCHCDGYSEDDE